MATPTHPTDLGNGTMRNHRVAEGGGRSFWAGANGRTHAAQGEKTLWTTEPLTSGRTRAQHAARRLIDVAHDRPIWCDRSGRTVVTLSTHGLGCRLDAHRGADGTPLWSRVFPLPAPAPFARQRPGTESDEQILGFLTDTPDALALGFQRTTPTSALWPAPIPDFEASLELRGIDPRTGAVRWHVNQRDAHIGIINRSLYEGLHTTPEGVCSVNLKSGRPRLLYRWKARVASQPRRIGRNVVFAYSRGACTYGRVLDERSTKIIAAWETPRAAKHSLDIKHAGGLAVVNLDAHGYVVLGPPPGFSPSPLMQIKGYFDGLTAEPGNVVCINARHTLVRVNAQTGEVLTTRKPSPSVENRQERTRAPLGVTHEHLDDASAPR